MRFVEVSKFLKNGWNLHNMLTYFLTVAFILIHMSGNHEKVKDLFISLTAWAAILQVRATTTPASMCLTTCT